MDELRTHLGQLHAATMVQLNYAKTLALLRALKAGTVALDAVHVEGDNWSLVEVVESPPSPSGTAD